MSILKENNLINLINSTSNDDISNINIDINDFDLDDFKRMYYKINLSKRINYLKFIYEKDKYKAFLFFDNFCTYLYNINRVGIDFSEYIDEFKVDGFVVYQYIQQNKDIDILLDKNKITSVSSYNLLFNYTKKSNLRNIFNHIKNIENINLIIYINFINIISNKFLSDNDKMVNSLLNDIIDYLIDYHFDNLINNEVLVSNIITYNSKLSNSKDRLSDIILDKKITKYYGNVIRSKDNKNGEFDNIFLDLYNNLDLYNKKLIVNKISYNHLDKFFNEPLPIKYIVVSRLSLDDIKQFKNDKYAKIRMMVANRCVDLREEMVKDPKVSVRKECLPLSNKKPYLFADETNEKLLYELVIYHKNQYACLSVINLGDNIKSILLKRKANENLNINNLEFDI